MHETKPPAFQILMNWWESTNAGIRIRGATTAEIAGLEHRYDILLPDSFRAYLAHAATADDPSYDNELTNWWPISRIRNLTEEYENPVRPEIAVYRDRLIFFADYSIWCWAWAINCYPGKDYGKVACIGGPGGFVADTFDDFIERYIREDPTLVA
ncbi:MAG: SMI1/KNR4 family protein [Sphingomonadales bacterium]